MTMLHDNTKKTAKKIKKKKAKARVPVRVVTQTPLTIQDVFNAVKPLGVTDGSILTAMLAVYVSTFLGKSDPLWLMVVGNPSSNKTTLVDLLKYLDDVYRLDTMTSNPFSSGQREKEKPKDLLPLIDGKCFVIKEYGTIFGRSDEMVKQLISDLVAIYDGEYSKHSPTRGTVRYKATFSHIGCVTPSALSSRQRYMNAVGARFMFLKVPSLSVKEKEENFGKIWGSQSSLNKKKIAKVVGEFCLQLKEKVTTGLQIEFSSEIKSKLNNLALLMAHARGIVVTDKVTFNNEGGEKVVHYEASEIQIEEPFRALKQIIKMARALAIVFGNSQIADDELSIVRQIVLSSMPVRRADVLKVFEKGNVFTATKASDLLDRNYRTVKRNLDELVCLEVLKSEKGANDKARTYTLMPKFVEIFNPPDVTREEVVTLFDSEK